MTQFLDDFIDKNILRSEDEMHIDQIQHSFHMPIQCEPYRLCVFAFWDTDSYKEGERDMHTERVNILKRVWWKYSSQNIKIAYADGYCYHDLLENLGIKVRRGKFEARAFAYHATRNEFFVMEKEDFDYENVDSFIGKTLLRKGTYGIARENFQFPGRNCHMYKEHW